MSYEDAGFDAFLSRSIDNVSQVNLNSQGPVTSQIAYDRTQVDGMLGDTLQIGNIGLNGSESGIDLRDGSARTMFIGKDSKGNQVVKVAQPGFDAKTARDDQLRYNSGQNVLKIVKTGLGSAISNGAPTNWSTNAHGLGFVPIPLVFLNDVNLLPVASSANIPLPTYGGVSVSGGTVNFTSWLHAVTDKDNLYVVMFNGTGLPKTLNFKYYLLQESAA